jgi:hypothetical protein
MWSVDVIIIDHVVTGIGELLLTDKPIVALLPSDGRLATEKARNLLEKRAIVSDNYDSFLEDINKLIIFDNDVSRDLQNHDFEKAYTIGDESKYPNNDVAVEVIKLAKSLKKNI